MQPLFAALSLSFVVASVGTTQTALLTRAMSFRALELRTMASGLVGAAVGPRARLRGRGAWAIIAQQLTIVVVGTMIICAATPWRPHFVFSVASLREPRRLQRQRARASALIFYVHRNADNLLIGRFLGASALGVYALGLQRHAAADLAHRGPVQEVLFPAFSRMQGNREAMARRLGARHAPGRRRSRSRRCCGLVVVAPDFVTVVLGDRWSEAIPVIQVLSWVGLLQSLQALNGDMLQALDRTTLLFRYSLFFFAAHMTAFACGLPFGVVGVAVAYAISSTVVEPVYAYLTARAVDISVWTFVGGVFGVVQAAVLMARGRARRPARTRVRSASARRFGWSPASCVGLAVYPLAVRWRAPEVSAEVRAVRARRRAAAAAGVDPSPSSAAAPAPARRPLRRSRARRAACASAPATATPLPPPADPPRGRCPRGPPNGRRVGISTYAAGRGPDRSSPRACGAIPHGYTVFGCAA